jgi:hypothetical protein
MSSFNGFKSLMGVLLGFSRLEWSPEDKPIRRPNKTAARMPHPT